MPSSAVDRDALIALLDGNPDLIVTIIDSFLDDCPNYMEDIREAVDEENAKVLEQKAHGLKGAAGSLRATPASEAAQVLEEIGHSDDFSGAETALETLEEEVDRLKEALRTLRRQCRDETASVDD
jgi:HPt (histidine-containing phosphotransfer) domain-containing protein